MRMRMERGREKEKREKRRRRRRRTRGGFEADLPALDLDVCLETRGPSPDRV